MLDQERKIEVHAERVMDRLDSQFMDGSITEQQYSAAVRRLNDWCAWEYQRLALKAWAS